MFKLRAILREEEEGGGGGGGGYCFDLPASLESLGGWWNEAIRGVGEYPIYAIFIANSHNDTARILVDKSKKEIAIISGAECCFLYFRDGEKAKKLKPWDWSEHIEYSMALAKVLDIVGPHIIFVNSDCLNSDEQTRKRIVKYSLKNRSPAEVMDDLQRIFSAYYEHKENSDYLSRLAYGNNKAMKYHVISSAIKYGRESALLIFRSTGKVVLSLLS